jgi:hypothetical protein
MEHTYRISFKIGDQSFEIESTDLKWLEGKEKDYFDKLRKDKAPTMSRQLPQPEININEFFRRYIREKQIKSRTTIAVFFVYYLEKMSKKDEIKMADVRQCFKDASYPNWNKLNVTDILLRARRQALLNYVNKLWSLTTTGEDFVLNTITGEEE